MSIIRIGLGETKHFAEGYEAIFGKKKTSRLKGAKGTAKGKKKVKAKKK